MSENEDANLSIDDLISDCNSLFRKLKSFKKSQKLMILGFTVTEAKGYNRAIRSINGTTYSIHLGKKFDVDVARKKIGDAIEKMPEADKEFIRKKSELSVLQ